MLSNMKFRLPWWLKIILILEILPLIKLTTETTASKVIVGLAFVTNFAILLIFGFRTVQIDPLILYILIFLFLVCLAIEAYMQKVRKRTIKPCSTVS
jgi:hypothetical protein